MIPATKELPLNSSEPVITVLPVMFTPAFPFNLTLPLTNNEPVIIVLPLTVVLPDTFKDPLTCVLPFNAVVVIELLPITTVLLPNPIA